MEWWQIAAIIVLIVTGLGIAAIKMSKSMRKIESLKPRFLCPHCNRYYETIETHLCHVK
jgi:transcription elongation factor Elf1